MHRGGLQQSLKKRVSTLGHGALNENGPFGSETSWSLKHLRMLFMSEATMERELG